MLKLKLNKIAMLTLDIDGDTGEVLIKSIDDVEKVEPFKAMEIVTAIGRGFSPDKGH